MDCSVGTGSNQIGKIAGLAKVNLLGDTKQGKKGKKASGYASDVGAAMEVCK